MARKLAGTCLVLLLGGGLLFLCYEALGHSGFFQIVAIDIKGCERIDKDEILEMSGVSIHSNLIKISRRRVRERVEGHRWVEGARVTGVWPDRLIISVRERAPVALINLDDGLHYIDKSGTVFAPLTASADLDYPVISGWTGGKGEGESDYAVVLQEALQIIKYAGRDNPNLPVQNISEIRIADNSVVMFLTDRPFPIRLGRGEMWTKYIRLTKVLYWLYKRKEFQGVAYIDADYGDDRILIGMDGG
ncbi:MAG: FtsQ-type POTRA domain-containing protein [Desulfurivibrionaceae bacterium]|nr:FtsQ-type POTRA domain-containing protein [Desulfurivibrionaceae bacterium]